MIDIATQYRIIAAGAGWLDKTARGRLRFDGADRALFLQALLSNEIAALEPGAGTYALYLTPQGRMIADLHVFVRPDCLIADVPAANAAGLVEALDRLIFTEDVRVADESRALRQLSVVGGAAADVVSRALGVDADALGRLPAWFQLDTDAGFVARTDDANEGSWDVIVGEQHVDRIVAALEGAGAVPAAPAVVEAMRIDAGRPEFGVDMTGETIPLEAGLLERAISQTKGCYVGQEVIIRVLHRGGGRVARRLVRMACEDGAILTLPARAIVSADGRQVGSVTSAAFSPRAGRVVALGYVHRDSADVGRRVVISWPAGDNGAVAARAEAVITAMAG
jgi:folate-binding protein YgfZ